jgi:hypothetical protein
MPQGQFLSPLDARDLPGDKIELLAPLVYLTAAAELIVVPRSFVCDQTSVVPTAGDYDWAAVLHDWLYRFPLVNGRPITRRRADAIYWEAMGAAQVSQVVCWTFWAGVRIFGRVWAWNRHRQAEQQRDGVATL